MPTLQEFAKTLAEAVTGGRLKEAFAAIDGAYKLKTDLTTRIYGTMETNGAAEQTPSRRRRGRPPAAATAQQGKTEVNVPVSVTPTPPTLAEQIRLAIVSAPGGRIKPEELLKAIPGARANHIGSGLSRHKRAGRAVESDGFISWVAPAADQEAAA